MFFIANKSTQKCMRDGEDYRSIKMCSNVGCVHGGSLSDPEAAGIGNRREGVLDENVYPIKMLMRAAKDCSVSVCVHSLAALLLACESYRSFAPNDV